MNELMETKEFTKQEALAYLKSSNLSKARFFVNVYGWTVYYTLKPTWCTPTGNLKEFPRSVVFTNDNL